jgi:hypothetical protein
MPRAENPTEHAHREEIQAEVLPAYHERQDDAWDVDQSEHE